MARGWWTWLDLECWWHGLETGHSEALEGVYGARMVDLAAGGTVWRPATAMVGLVWFDTLGPVYDHAYDIVESRKVADPRERDSRVAHIRQAPVGRLSAWYRKGKETGSDHRVQPARGPTKRGEGGPAKCARRLTKRGHCGPATTKGEASEPEKTQRKRGDRDP